MATPLIPLHIVTENGAREFLNSHPSLEQVTSRSLSELRVIASHLQLTGAASLSRYECLSCIQSVWPAPEQPRLMRQGATTGEVRGADVSYQFNTPPVTSTPVVAMEESHVKGREEREVRQSPDREILNTGFPGVLSSEALLQVELKKLEIESRRMELEAAERQREWEIKERLENKKIESALEQSRLMQARGGRTDDGSVEVTSWAQLNQLVNLTPMFDESRVTEWFLRFEKKATLLDWPAEKWSVVLSHVLKGKALEAYDRLSVEEARDYETIKSHVLRAYELRPEAYRRAFRGARKRPGDTYTSLARYLTDSLEKWLRSEQVDRLKEVVLMEQFIESADKYMNVWLREKRFPAIGDAAVGADDRVLALKGSEWKVSQLPRLSQDKGAGVPGVMGHGTQFLKPVKDLGKGSGKKSPFILCFFCKQAGHIRSQCTKFKASQEPKSVAVTAGVGTHSYTRYLSKGTVIVDGIRYPVTVLRDTGAEVSVLRNVTNNRLRSKEYVLVRGLHTDQYLNYIMLDFETEFITGPRKVAVADSLPVDGVDLLLGNDLVSEGGTVTPMVVSESPVDPPEKIQENVEDEMVYRVCAVTRSMAKLADQEERLAWEETEAGTLTDRLDSGLTVPEANLSVAPSLGDAEVRHLTVESGTLQRRNPISNEWQKTSSKTLEGTTASNPLGRMEQEELPPSGAQRAAECLVDYDSGAFGRNQALRSTENEISQSTEGTPKLIRQGPERPDE
ncbi:hypothetical protein Pcinc_009395 [Petrolisthes cinctipes]|uniref:CCHC-type domain-containing protein n=1 Tax=Petrolisthes cinctipes TaxID=88211 RepID=A0AAE1G732_PETCI|nr:hypothetical protein Pcinc_009395 [Petrolisthes cinctipes]